MNRLNKYLPEFVGSIKEFQALDHTLSQELNTLDHTIQEIQNNQFIETANEKGLSRYERLLRIKPNKDVDIRRFNILTKFNSTMPFTMRWLQNTLNSTVGQNNYLIDLDHTKCHLTISIIKHKENIIDHLRQELEGKLPAHLVLSINILNPVESSHYFGAYIRTSDTIEI